MEMREETKQDVLVLHLEGELMGGEDSKAFQERLYEAIRQSQVNVVINMADVKWMNSSGLGILMAGLTTLRGSEGDLRLAEVQDRVKRPIEITKLNQVLGMYKTVDAAIQSYEQEA
ncbi:STAS domain-containing protein [candidate division KSB1 bacterium]|nr:STAS domain-containing protein [candidate division KSB1 bacterium]